MWWKLKELTLTKRVNEWLYRNLIKFMCKLGRHDYEFDGEIYAGEAEIEGGKLRCSCCDKIRNSYLS